MDKIGYTKYEDSISDQEKISIAIRNLTKRKIIYHEVTTVIARIDKVIISPDGFEAMATKLATIPNPYGIRDIPFPKKWEFGAIWDILTIENDTIHANNINWTIWIDQNLISEVEKLLLLNKTDEIHQLLWEIPMDRGV